MFQSGITPQGVQLTNTPETVLNVLAVARFG